MKIEEAVETAADINALAERAADAFYGMAVKYGTGKFPRNLRKSRNWPKFVHIARKAMVCKVDVTRYVEAAFENTMLKHPIVLVADILTYNPANVEKVANAEVELKNSPKDMWNMLSCKLLDMAFALDGESKSSILNNELYGFPAWFRVFFPDVPDENILARWSDIAHEELHDNPVLEAYLKNKRPDTFALLDRIIEVFNAGEESGNE